MIPNLVQIYLVGFYEEQEFALYISSISNELKRPVRYLREDKSRGSARGLYKSTALEITSWRTVRSARIPNY
ncbi:hypothetical protein ABZP36_029389 [Zizania latifolia]